MGTIITKNSATSGSVPSSLIQGELAINVTNGRLFYGSGSGNVVKEFLSGTTIDTGSFATTGSNTFNGSQIINGNLTVNGTASISFLNVTYESASVIYSSGSNQFGDASNDTQTLWGTVDIKTGPVLVTGSLNAPSITGSLLGTSSWAVTASHALNALSASYALTASFITASGVYGPYGSNSVISASFAVTASSALNAQDILIRVLNQSGNPISKGIVVHITASDNSSDIPRVITASYENDNNSANTLGIANETIANGAEGFIMTEGVLKGIDTSAFVSGQLIYLGATGSIIGTAPLAPLHNVRLGQVVREQSNNGSIYVRIDNGYELGELHDVRDTTTTSSYGDLLVKSGSIWINSKQLTGSYGLTGSLTATSFTGSLQGTSSWADNAVTSSYILNAVSASFATTASRAVTAASATQASTVSISGISTNAEYAFPLILTGSSGPSIGLNNDTNPGFSYNASTNLFKIFNLAGTGSLLGTASWADNATTASYVLNAVSASFASTASFVPTLKASSASVASFGGRPYSASVTFGTAYPNNLYSVTVTGEDSRAWSISSKTSTGFTIDTNSSTLLTGPVYWIATPFNL